MPLAKVHVLESQYDKTRLGKMSKAIQDALIEVLDVPPDDFFQVHHVLPRDRYRHTPAFLGQEYSDEMISARTDIHHGATEGDAVGTPQISQREDRGGGQYIAGRFGGPALRGRRRERLIRQRPCAARPHRGSELSMHGPDQCGQAVPRGDFCRPVKAVDSVSDGP